ncbi:MAG: arginine repressor [Lachnospiraceae bacterium]|nr:arginine repressor [Lachnospiraceae bacterium]
MKTDRHEAILRIIKEQTVQTQEQLTQLLLQEGFEVTQATVSRDIRKLGLTKSPVKGKMSYVLMERENVPGSRYVNVLKEGFQSADTAGNILVIKTVSGMAMAVAAAVDAMEFKQVVGSIAGDDTIMIAIKSEAAARDLIRQLKHLIMS